ncbi:3-deoxy-D-manno-octulosonic acid transferase [Roseibium aggregatum]|uniref:3-deoxy-D-manno-octulosonic acid transferase n=1 Tax=Roseibium aggregatum TaxID=187304 RepID=A0A939E9J6_9HYPH|nr:3-deoxy-D-manno-octulosonic acid transferase [Roseibium aggregatum]MBN9669107.1 3-deoxy-D-manno-octulosonic acid transferase [Roseibium aggregatum]
MAERHPVSIRLYKALAAGLTPLFHLLFHLRCRSGKEVRQRKGERFGRPGMPRPPGRLVWIHAASVGETTSVLPLIEALTGTGATVLLTTVTVTSAELAERRLPDGAIHQFIPYDAPGPVARFLDHWSPDLAMVVESEIWPCLFDEMRGRPAPFLLVNGRLSDKSRANWSRLPSVAAYVFRCLDMVLAQSAADARRFEALGCRNVAMPGNLKFDAAEPPVNTTDLTSLKAAIGDRPVWLAALTHPGEDEIVLSAFRQLRKELPDLVLFLAPRHPSRADDIMALATAEGMTVSCRSLREEIGPETQIYLGDTLGEMGLFYRLAPVAFLGGSFTDVGGHNPVEAALTGSALVTGPKVANARAVYKDFWNNGAAVRVSEPADLAERVLDLLKHPEKAQTQAAAARDLVDAGRGALEKTLDLLQPYLKDTEREPVAETVHEQSA